MWPYINLSIYLRSYVWQRANIVGAIVGSAPPQRLGETKVYDFQCVIGTIYNYVLWLEIPMDNLFLVHKYQGLCVKWETEIKRLNSTEEMKYLKHLHQQLSHLYRGG